MKSDPLFGYQENGERKKNEKRKPHFVYYVISLTLFAAKNPKNKKSNN